MPTPVKIPVVVEEILQHTDALKTLVLRPLKRVPNFRPGQFLHLAIDPYDPSFNWPESRVFSIANSPTRRDLLSVIFSVKGAFTTRMFHTLREGDNLWVKLPYGSFTFPDDAAAVVLIAGGTGITPFLSYLQYAVDRGLESNITLYYGIRSAAHLVGDPALHEAEERLARFRWHLFLEEGDGAGIAVRGPGYVPIGTVLQETADLNAAYYLAGPPLMITAFRSEMLQAGITKDRIMVDEWE